MEYGNKYYALTDKRTVLSSDKTETEDFWLLTLMDIGKEFALQSFPEGEYDVILAVGLPPGHMSIPELKNKTRNYYLRGEIVFAYNGAHYQINIKNVIVCPQGYSALYSNSITPSMRDTMLSKGKNVVNSTPLHFIVGEPQVLLFDLGGGTFDVTGLNHGKPMPEYHISLPIGMVNLYNSINAEMLTRYGEELPEKVINQILLGKEIRLSDSHRKIITDCTNDFAHTSLQKLYELQFPLSSSYNLFIGGGSIVMQNYWSTGDGLTTDFLTNINANSQGYERYTYEMLSRK